MTNDETTPPRQRTCPQCGYALGPFDEECPRCGRRGAEARPEPPTPPEAPVPPTRAAPGPPQPLSPAPSSGPLAGWALGLGIAGLVMCPICGPFALWLGIRSQREEGPNTLAIVGIVLGAIAAVAMLVPFLLVVIWMIYKFTLGTNPPPSLPPLPGGPGLLLKLLPWS